MPTTEDIKTWRGHEARSSDGDKLGKIAFDMIDWINTRTFNKPFRSQPKSK